VISLRTANATHPSDGTTVSAGTPWNLSLSIQLFLYLQVLDFLTTCVGFRLGLDEASPFIQFLMHLGPMAGVAASKVVAVGLGAFCVWQRRFRVIQIMNYWYAALVVWNLALIVSR
jgi:hypothetical protein